MAAFFGPVEMGGGYFDIGLVMLSYGVAVLASFTALSLSKRYAELRGRAAFYWLLAGSFSMGLGIWSMHFVGMLAFSMDMPFSYDISITLASLFVGMLSACCAIYASSGKKVGAGRLLGGGLILGCGIAGMHYTGMEGMVMPAALSYDPLIFSISIVIAVVVSVVALWMMSRINLKTGQAFRLKVAAALIMGFAICGMHYTGMAAAIYTPIPDAVMGGAAHGLSQLGIGLTVAAATVVVLLITLLTVYFERKLDVEKEVAERLGQEVRERTHDLEVQAKNLEQSNVKLEQEVRERQVAQEESTRLSYILDESSSEIYYFEEEGLKFLGANKGAQRNIQFSSAELKTMTLLDLMNDYSREEFDDSVSPLASSKKGPAIFETRFQRKDGSIYLAKVNLHRSYATEPAVFVAIVEDITERKKLEEQLSQSRKLESIGQLAAGVAHEINTPIQFIGDNILFVQDFFGDVNQLIEPYGEILQSIKEGAGALSPEKIAELEENFEKLDYEYTSREVPKALSDSMDGIKRVSDIVSAMKEFSHPGQAQSKTMTQINHSLETTLTVSANEWKYVAEVEKQLDPDLPMVECLPGELNQVFLNLIVNASHAIDESNSDKGVEKGTITLATSSDDEWVEIRIKDTGNGIPAEVAERIFEPFFTTKGVGKGTGQGLSIAHNIVVTGHQGQLFFETEQGKGTTFVVRLPRKQSENLAVD